MQIDLKCGDCLVLMEELGDNSIDLVVTSPPYGLAKEYETDDPRKQLEENVNLIENLFVRLARVIKRGGYVVINFGDNGFGKKINSDEVLSTIPMAIHHYPIGIKHGFELQATRIWRKSYGAMKFPFFLNHHPRPVFDYEHIWTWRKPSGDGAEKVSDHSISRRGVWTTSTSDEAYQGGYETGVLDAHCAAYPVVIPQNAIELYSDEGNLVLDPFLGSGTTAIAAIRTNRNFLGFEINSDYFAGAQKRIQNELAKQGKANLIVSDSVQMSPLFALG